MYWKNVFFLPLRQTTLKGQASAFKLPFTIFAEQCLHEQKPKLNVLISYSDRVSSEDFDYFMIFIYKHCETLRCRLMGLELE